MKKGQRIVFLSSHPWSEEVATYSHFNPQVGMHVIQRDCGDECYADREDIKVIEKEEK